MSTEPETLADLPLVDHHCHGVVVDDVDRATFEDLITESDVPAPPGATFFDTQLGMSIRRHCAPVLDLPPFASPEDYLARRLEIGGKEASRRLLMAAGITDYIVETGHQADRILAPREMGDYAGAGYAEVVRLERLGEQVLEDGLGDDYVEAFAARLDTALRGAVGVKSIAAYRGGLELDPERPDAASVKVAAERARGTTAHGGRVRLTDPVLIRHGLWEAVDRGLPIQLHIGYGDPDVDLHRCNPLLLTELLRRTRGSGARWLLLHCYPFHREAGYLAHVFEHVWCDVGLAVNYTGARSPAIIAESLELTPFNKALFSSDAFGAAELFHLGALLFRHGLGESLARWGWPAAEQRRIAEMIGAENARQLYGLDQVPTSTFGDRR